MRATTGKIVHAKLRYPSHFADAGGHGAGRGWLTDALHSEGFTGQEQGSQPATRGVGGRTRLA